MEQTFDKGLIYTLAESGTNKRGQNNTIVNGDGTDLNNIDALKGRAKRKTITQSMMLKLIDIAKENGEPELEKAYWNTYYCQQEVITADGKLYGKYCKNRFCTLCCSIRKAEMINKYYPEMRKWKKPYFLTLTVKSCTAPKLDLYIKKFNIGFRRITAKYRKKHQRGRGKLLVGVKSLECNFNPKARTYNPHFHIITKDRETAEILLKEWLKLWTPKHAKRPAQNIQKVHDLEKGLIEIIKYGSKIFTEPDLKKRAKETDTTQIYAKALDTILTAMKGKRIFDRFGFNLPKSIAKHRPQAKLLSNFKEWEYNPKIGDWESTSTAEVLTGYKAPSHLQAILDNNINANLS
ncbi:protein rep [Arenibacter algicola]|uniref:protein rep n=1 Tax=Arenibacter algicola TaxID=616991 RepID=UPI001C07292A|nr:protein rep [Arenibacter algicola]MBU2904692.1 protein rep [Arenibacter algicola]